MKNTKTKVMALAASAALVAMLGLAACGGSSSSSAASSSAASSSAAASSASASSEAASSASASASSAAASASTAASSAATSASTAASSAAASASADATEADSATVAALEQEYADKNLFGYEGISSAGELYFLAMNADATYGILVILDENGNYLSFVGPMARDLTTFQIVDETTGDSFTFDMTDADGGAYLFDAGEAGQIVIAPVDVDEVFEALAEIDAKGTAVN